MGGPASADKSGWTFDEAVSSSSTLRQGDLIRFEDTGDPLRRYGIVVTADCDLEQKKHSRSVTLVPVLSTQDVMECYLLPEDFDRKRDQIMAFAFQYYNIDCRQDVDTKLSLLRTAIVADVADPKLPAKLAARYVLDELSRVQITIYKEIMAAIKLAPKGPDAFKNKLRSKGDLLILPDTTIFGVIGGAAWIRHLWQVPLSTIAIRTSEVSLRQGELLARLDSPFRYRLTQLIGHVFSDIGLPSLPDTIDQHVEEAYSRA